MLKFSKNGNKYSNYLGVYVVFDHQLIDSIKNRENNLSKLIIAAEAKISELPEGRVRLKRVGSVVYYYFVSGDTNINGVYLSANDRDNVKALIQKEYLKKVVITANAEKKVLQQAISRFPKITAEDVYSELPAERQKFITPIVRPDDEYVREWLAEEYPRKGFKEGTPYYMTMNNERVRSKAEQIIADHLREAGIPYKYEYPTKINNELIHPDFKILRISDRKELYLEHCGRLDKPDYYDDMSVRINNYAMNGITIGDNLFLLFETAKVPLDVRVLEKMINEQFR